MGTWGNKCQLFGYPHPLTYETSLFRLVRFQPDHFYCYTIHITVQFCSSVMKKLDPPIFVSPSPNIWTPGTKMFEIYGPSLKYFIPLQNFILHAKLKGPDISAVIIDPLLSYACFILVHVLMSFAFS